MHDMTALIMLGLLALPIAAALLSWRHRQFMRQQRKWLEGVAAIWGVQPKPKESVPELRKRVLKAMRGPP
jgi:hypothetical protein